VKGGVILLRGGGTAARRYLEADRSQADDYYLQGGTALASFTITGATGAAVAEAGLDPEQYAVALIASFDSGCSRVLTAIGCRLAPRCSPEPTAPGGHRGAVEIRVRLASGLGVASASARASGFALPSDRAA